MARRSVSLFFGAVAACAAAVLLVPTVKGGIVLAGEGSDGSVKINEQNFPDDAFREKVMAYDKDGDQSLSASERNITQIIASNCGIESLNGIEYFPALRKLVIANNKIKNLDLSHNTELRDLTCSSNAMESINLKGLTNLQILYCGTNKLKEIDLTTNTALSTVDLQYNSLTELDLTNNTKLRSLRIFENPLKSIDLTKNTALSELECYSCGLTKLILTENTSLTKLECSRNNLTQLNLSNNTELQELRCQNNQLTQLNLSANTGLTFLNCSNNQISTLNVSKLTALEFLYCSDNKIGSLDVSKNTMLQVLECSGNLIKTLDVSDHAALVTLECCGNSDTPDSMKLTSLNVTGATKLSSLVLSFTAVKTLDLSTNTMVKTLYLIGVKTLSSLDLSKQTELSSFFGNSMKISSLDLSNKSKLSYVYLDSVEITNLNLSGATKLAKMSFHYGDTKITNLDISGATALTDLDCDGISLSTLKVSGDTALLKIVCGTNNLKSLDVSTCTALQTLKCEGNSLTTLKIAGATQLSTLMCTGNSLTSLNVSKNTNLKVLECFGNPIASLDLNSNPLLNACMSNRSSTTMVATYNGVTCYGLIYEGSNGAQVIVDKSTNVVSSYLTPTPSPTQRPSPTPTPVIVVKIDEQHFPDEAFRNCILWFYDKDYDKALSEKEVADTTELSVSSSGQIYTLKGVEYFTELKRLTCYMCGVTELDVSKLTNLEYLDCAGNQIKKLDCSKNVNLKTLNVSNNGMTTLNISGLSNLKVLRSTQNSLSKINLNGCTILLNLIKSESRQATGMDEFFTDKRVVPSYTYGESGTTTGLLVYDRYTDLSASSLTPTPTPKAPASGSVAVNSTNFPDAAFRQYIKEVDMDENRNGALEKSELNKVDRLLLQSRGIKNLKGLEYFENLVELDCQCNQLTSLDLTKSPQLEYLMCHKNQIKTLDLYFCPSLSKTFKEGEKIDNEDYLIYWLTEVNNYFYFIYVDPSTTVTTTKPTAGKPTGVKAESASATSVKVSWNAVTDATGYQVWRSTSSSGTYTSLGTVTTTSKVSTSLTTGTTYYYKVRAYKEINGTKYYGAYSSVVSAVPKVAAPTGVKAASASATSIKVSWSAVSGATGYQVWRATSSTGTYTSLGTVTTTSKESVGLTAGKTYYYKVRAYKEVNGTKKYGDYSVVVSAVPKPSAPSGVKAVSASSTSVKVSWTAVSGATGYEVYRCTTADGTYSKLGSVTTTSRTCGSLTTGKTYYFKVRAYTEVNGTKVYSGYSTVVSAAPKA